MRSQLVKSLDGTELHFEASGQGDVALLFAHGWLGNLRWWDQQRDAFSNDFQIIQVDLAGHGKSSSGRKKWSVKAYAEDICSVVEKLQLAKVVLIGHSMSGSSVVEAYQLMPNRVARIILVDTLSDLDHMPSLKEAAPLFDGLRQNYQATIEQPVANYLFAKTSPQGVVNRLIGEFKAANPDLAISMLEPFYSTEIRPSCSKIKVPVRAINSDLYPTSVDTNRKYFSDYNCQIIPGVGHYPMLEAPEKFNLALKKALTE